MKTNFTRWTQTLVAVAIAFATISPPSLAQRGSGAKGLAGTSWKLVKLQGGDEVTSVPADASKYTITFGSNGRVTARVDCNRGGSSWKTPGANKLQFGSWSMTRAKCPSGSLHDRIVTEGAAVNSYYFKDGHLFLKGVAAGGHYELEPIAAPK